MKTAEIRARLRKSKIKQWELAKQAGVCEYTITRWFRDPVLPRERAEIIEPALEELEYVRGMAREKE